MRLKLKQDRKVCVWWIGGLITAFSALIIFNFGKMFGLVISLTTQYTQPILGVCFALLVGWVWKRDKVLAEIKEGNPDLEKSLFWKIWPWYVRVVCPIMLILVFSYSL